MQRRTSLRELARQLGVTHVSLSRAARAGTLTQGVSFDAADRLVVDDPAAAAAEWRNYHAPRARMPPMPRSAPPPASDPLDTVLPDCHMGCTTTARELFEQRDTAHLLNTALVAIALDAAGADALPALVAASLCRVAVCHAADADAIGRAENDLDSIVTMLLDEPLPAA